MSQYSFIDNNYFKKDETSKDIFNVSKEFKNVEDVTALNKGILNWDTSVITVKNIEKGV